MATIEDFMKLDIRVGKIIDAKIFEKAKRPAYQLKIDFGSEIGVKKSSAQITEVYKLEDLIGKQILAVVNFPPRQIANFLSEVLVLGTYSKQGIVLIKPDELVENGNIISEADVTVDKNIDKAGYFTMFIRNLKEIISANV